jgi:hypothetical protein
MSNKGRNQKLGDAKRTGGEAKLQKALKKVDETVGEEIIDNANSPRRKDRQRSKFTDLWEDEDGNIQTTEATAQTTSTSSTPRTTSTSSPAGGRVKSKKTKVEDISKYDK